MRTKISFIICAMLISLEISGQTYHSFQNWDDDVDRIKTYSNSFGGNSDIQNNYGQVSISKDSGTTRNGYGRSLKIEINSISSFVAYLESFSQKCYDNNEFFDLSNLFPDFESPSLKYRSIDSIVFYYQFNSTNNLNFKLELHDTSGGASAKILSLQPTNNKWDRIAVALNQFSGNFNESISKYLGFTLGSHSTHDTLWIDDIMLVENKYSEPTFKNDIEFLEYINEISFRHFWQAVEPVSKFALDRHIWSDLISTDAIGFQLATYTIAHRKRWVDTSKIENRVEHILDYLLHYCKHGDSISAKTYPLKYASVDGNWAHFLDSESLGRKDVNTEYSLFTNALLLPGVIVCKAYFKQNQNIQKWADSLIGLTDWNFFFRKQDSLMYYSWSPEKSFSDAYSDWFTEELDLAFLLAKSSKKHPIPANPFINIGYNKPCCNRDCGKYIFSAPGANFTYYFLQMYAKYDTTSYRFRNTQNALKADKYYSNGSFSYLKYDNRIYGITACEGPDSSGVGVSNYHAYGYSCKHDVNNDPNGTIAVYGSASTMPFIPSDAKNCLKYYYYELDRIFDSTYNYSFWSSIFGFPDAFHLNPDSSKDPLINQLGFRGPWISVPRFGIDIGPMIIQMDNYLSSLNGDTSVSDLFTHYMGRNNLDSFEFEGDCICGDSLNANFIIKNSTQCLNGNTFYFQDTSFCKCGETIYLWNFGDSSTSKLKNPTHSYLYSDSFPVKLIITSSQGCIDSVIKMVNVNPSPSLRYNINDKTQCLNSNSFTLTNLSSINSGSLTYKWDFGDNNTSTYKNPTHSYNLSGTYFITLTAKSDSGCSTSLNDTVHVNPNPSASFSIDSSPQCLNGNLFHFQNNSSIANGAISKWFWNFGDTNISIHKLDSHSYKNAGSFEIKLIVTSDSGCVDSITKTISVLPSPKANFIINDSVQCLNGNQFIFTNQSTADNGTLQYDWNFGSGYHGNLKDPKYKYKTTGHYDIILIIISNNGCTDTIMKPIWVNPNPVAKFSINDLSQCLNENLFVFYDHSSISNDTISKWRWDFGDTNTSILKADSHSYQKEDSFKVTLVVTSNNSCSDRDSAVVRVNPSPMAGFKFNIQEPYPNQLILFTDTSSLFTGTIETSIWDFDDNSIDTTIYDTITHFYTTPKEYFVKLIVISDSACTDSAVNSISVGPNSIFSSFNDQIIRIFPNPTQGILNIGFSEPITAPLTLSIFDFTGKLVYSKKYAVNTLLIDDINISENAKGIYFIRMVSEKQIFSNTFLLK